MCSLKERKKGGKKEILVICIDNNAHCFLGSFGFSRTLSLVLPVRLLPPGGGAPLLGQATSSQIAIESLL